MYYSCQVKAAVDNDKIVNTFYRVGNIKNNNNVLTVNCSRTASLCQSIFNTKNATFKENIPNDADQFIYFLNKLFGNQYNAIFSEKELRDQKVKSADSYDKNKNITYGIVDLNNQTFQLLIDVFTNEKIK